VNRLTFVAYDSHLSTSGTSWIAYSSAGIQHKLAVFDQLAFEVVADEVAGMIPKLEVSLEHSADGEHFLPKAASPEIPETQLDVVNPNVLLGFDDGLKATLRFVRFKFKLTSANPGVRARVRVSATVNDIRQGRFAIKMRKLMEKSEEAGNCWVMLQAGQCFQGDDLRWRHLVDAKLWKYIKASPIWRAPEGQPEKAWYCVRPKTSICMLENGDLVVSQQGRQPILVRPAGAAGGGGGGGGGGMC
jgi:hypothetical protein